MKGSKIRFRYANGVIVDLLRRSGKAGSAIQSIVFKETTFERLSDGERFEINCYYKVALKSTDIENASFIAPGMVVQLLLKERMYRKITKKIRRYHAEVSLIDLMPFSVCPIINSDFDKANVA